MSRELITIETARELIEARVEPLVTESVPLRDALGRFLAEPLDAADDVPSFDNSAMDGYAVRATDTDGSSPLRIVGESRAGHPADRTLGEGEAIAISTGAMFPDGADAVVRVEDTERDGSEVSIAVPVPAGNNVRRSGEDVQRDARVLAPGVRLGAPELGALAMVGRPEAVCARAPRVATLLTGDELVEPGEPLGPGQIRDSNAYSVPPLATGAGAEAVSIELVGDDRGATRRALERALREDVVVVCGGVSVGEHDHVRPALEALEVEQVFWRVALRPGKPTYFGVAPGGALVFGLPGNPVSAMVTFILFVRPALLALQGADPTATRVFARLGVDYEKVEGRAEAIRVRLDPGPDGLTATPTGPQGSHVLTSMLAADGLAFAPTGLTGLKRGDRLEVELLR